ncbi:MAG: hypothetical protein LBL80_01700 [Ruminococcus sp.]|jgi:hypothetical protein|nr:hypothetical protein [Ruminococcus sp.]
MTETLEKKLPEQKLPAKKLSDQDNNIRKIIEAFNESAGDELVTADDASSIIRYSLGDYIVYLDKEDLYRFATTDKYEANMSPEDSKNREIMMADIALWRHNTAAAYLSVSIKKAFYSLLGECVVYTLSKNYDLAKSHLEYAKSFISDRKIEISRKWQLTYCLIILGIFILATFIVNIESVSDFFKIPESAILWTNFFAAGTAGATLSIISKKGDKTYNCESGKALNFLEIFARMVVAWISCFIIIICFDSDLVFAGLKGDHDTEVLSLLCVLAGFSERLIPSILKKIEDNEIGDNKTTA